MTITKTRRNVTQIIALEGKLDGVSASELQEALSSAFVTEKDVLLDFTELKYVSSAGLRVLLLGRKESKAKGISMRLRGVAAPVMEILEIIGFTEILHIE